MLIVFLKNHHIGVPGVVGEGRKMREIEWRKEEREGREGGGGGGGRWGDLFACYITVLLHLSTARNSH